MTAEQLNRIPELFAAALEHPADRRAAFLRQACDEDDELFAAVLSLLSNHHEADDFLAESAMHEAAQLLTDEFPGLKAGLRLGRYLILAPLGSGGMGEVWLARDDLAREVAIKILPDHFVHDPERAARFEREARTLAQLNHPNIAAIYGREQEADWRWLVLEYVRGETLSDRLRTGPLTVAEALPVFAQIAAALAATHSAGIIHRDLKPANIMFTAQGRVKLLDFGISRFIHDAQKPTVEQDDEDKTSEQSLTQLGMTPGTLAYMSPEQCAGQSEADGSDARGLDLWAFGLVFYEAITGVHPFRGMTRDETRAAIVHRDPDWQKLPSDTPPKLKQLLHQCLEKNPQLRLREADTAAELLAELQQPGLLHPLQKRLRGLGWPARLALLVAALLFISFSGWLTWRLLTQRNIAQPLRLAVIAVSDQHESQSCEPERARAVVALLRDRLRDVRGIQIIAPPDSSERAFPLLLTDLSVPQIARSQAADQVIRISLDCANNRRDISFTLINRQGEELVSGKESDVRQVILSVLRQMQRESDLPAWQSTDYDLRYYQALASLDQYASLETINDAISLLNELRQNDLNQRPRITAALGLAWYRKYNLTGQQENLHQAVSWCDQVSGTQSTEALLKCGIVRIGLKQSAQAIADFTLVLKQQPDDAEALLGLAQAYEHLPDLRQAEMTYQRAVSLRPDYWAGYNELGGFYFEQGRYQQAAEQWQKVVELLPLNPYGWGNLGNALLYQGNFAAAVDHYQQSISRLPTPDGLLNLGIALLYQGQCADAVSALTKAVQLAPDDPEIHGLLGDALHCDPARQNEAGPAWDKAISLGRQKMVLDPQDIYLQALCAEWLAKRGRNAQAIKQIQQTRTVATDNTFVLVSAIKVYYLTGRKNEALALLPQAAQEPNAWFDLQHAPELAGLRAEPAWQAVANQPRPQEK